MNATDNIVGLIPMAGEARRMGKLPFSKELYPVTFDSKQKAKPVGSYVIDCMRKTGITDFHLVIRKGKWDIPEYFMQEESINTCFHIAQYPYGVPFTLDSAYSFVKDKMVVLGFPDIIFEPTTAFKQVVDKLNSSNASVVLGSMPVSNPEKWDMIETSPDGVVENIWVKPKNRPSLKYNWIIAAWKSDFTHFMHRFVKSLLSNYSSTYLENNEYHLGDAFIAALKEKMLIQSILFENGKCLDVGTPEGIKKADAFLN